MFALDAYETKKSISEALNTMEFASLPAVMKTAQDLTRKVDTLTNNELASLISKDPFAIAKVMDMANRGAQGNKVTVSKLEDAILKVGYGKVRNVAYSLLDMEAAKAKLRYHEQGEIAAFALCSCLIAESTMRISGKHDPQEAYAATVLRSYGKVLMSAFLIHYYREAISLIPEKGEDSAFKQIFGITPIALTYELLKETKVPRELLRTLKPLDREVLELQFLSDTDELIINSEFAIQLTGLIFDHKVDPDNFETQAVEIMQSYNGKINLREDQLFGLIADLGELIQSLSSKYNLDPLPKGYRQIVKARINKLTPPEPPPPPPDPDNPDDVEVRTHQNPELILSEGVKELAWLASKRPVDMPEILNTTTRVFYTSLRTNDLIVFQKNDSTGTLDAVSGTGPMYKSMQDKLSVSPESKDVLGICIKEDYCALIHDTKERGINVFIPEWLREQKANSLFVLPIFSRETKEPVMLIMGANTNEAPIELVNTMPESIQTARRQLVKAMTGQAIPPSFLTKEVERPIDFSGFTKKVRKIMREKLRARNTGVSFS